VRSPPARLASISEDRARAKAEFAAPLKSLPELARAIDRLSQFVAEHGANGRVVDPSVATSGELVERSGRCFATSEYKRLYSSSEQDVYQHQLYSTLQNFLLAYARHVGQPESVANQSFEALQNAVPASLQGEAKKTAELSTVLWTSSSKLALNKEFCSILNEVIRNDTKDVMPHAVLLCRALAGLIVTRRKDAAALRWPDDMVTHRGTSMPREAVNFFTKDLTYRVPMFLATSFRFQTAISFMQRSPDGMVPVHFKCYLDPDLKCDHALYIENFTLVAGEEEFLYAPYSSFKVRNVIIPDGQIAWNNAIVIELEVQPNNKTISEDVALATWH